MTFKFDKLPTWACAHINGPGLQPNCFCCSSLFLPCSICMRRHTCDWRRLGKSWDVDICATNASGYETLLGSVGGSKTSFFFACKCYWDCFTLFVGVALTPFLTSKGGENGTGETVRTSHLPKRLFSSMVDYRSEMILRILAIWPIYTQEQSVCERETSPF